jgi:vitamin-K-epoxide reductase (warfarin-sensitive)
VVGYGVFLILATAYRSRAGTPNWLLALALVGLGFSVFLTLMEVYVLETWCILCLTSQGLIVAITLLAGVAVVRAALHG